ncbi:MAG: hypothetical protein JO069_00170 [Verrucomicrobia bacterium]|nr:hypothetical protein [Verrucomicrobiota bacterium]
MTTLQCHVPVLVAVLAAALSLGSSRGGPTGEADSAKSYAKICFSVATRGKDGRKEEAFSPEAKPGAGEWLLAHAVASQPCMLLVAAFDRASDGLANDWRPQIADLTEPWEEIALPQAGWSWQDGSTDFDLYAVFIQPGSADVADLKRLVAAMQRPDADPDLLRSQAEKLRELITRLCGDTDPEKHRAAVAPVEVSGVVRGSEEFAWRKFAGKVNFSNGHPGLLIFPGGGAANPGTAKAE